MSSDTLLVGYASILQPDTTNWSRFPQIGGSSVRSFESADISSLQGLLCLSTESTLITHPLRARVILNIITIASR